MRKPGDYRKRPLAQMLAFLPVLAVVLLPACGRLVPSQNQTIDPARLPGGAFELDPAHASLIWKVDHFGFSTYVGRFNDFDALLDFDPEDPAASRLEVTVDLASVDTGDAQFDETLRGRQWFDVEAFPQARFVARTIRVTGDDQGVAAGTLELNGRSGEVELDVTFNGGATNFVTGRYTLGFAATAKFSRSAFGIDYLVPAVGDEITLEIHAEFLKTP